MREMRGGAHWQGRRGGEKESACRKLICLHLDASIRAFDVT